MKDLLGVIYLGHFPVQACSIAHDFLIYGYYMVTLEPSRTEVLLSSWKPPILLHLVSVLTVLISIMLSVRSLLVWRMTLLPIHLPYTCMIDRFTSLFQNPLLLVPLCSRIKSRVFTLDFLTVYNMTSTSLSNCISNCPHHK